MTDSHLPTRMIAHLSVVGLVLFASAAGIAQAQDAGTPPSRTRAGTAFPLIVSAVRGAGTDVALSTPAAFSLTARPADDVALLDRGTRAQIPTPEPSASPAPLPTPVAIDPEATPLPAPTARPAVQVAGDAAVGGAPAASSAAPSALPSAPPTGPSSRSAAPPPAAGKLVWPVPGGSYSQGFHAGHLAVDIAAPYGTQIVAAQAGVVTSSGWQNNGGGNVISIDHGNGMVTVYNHLAASSVSAGQSVAAGQGIGSVGCTGMCTGPHVHFVVIVNGVIDNPQRYF